jgi:hypothetical protein
LISLFQSLPTIWHGLKGGLRDIGIGRSAGEGSTVVARTDRDLSMKFVGIGIIVLIAAVMLAREALHMNILGALLIIVFGFLFVTVSSRLTGEIGSSSNPISGMTVATLLFTCLIVPLGRLDGRNVLRDGALGGRDCVHRGFARRHDFAGPEDRLPPRRHAEVSADRDSRSARCSRRFCSGRFCSS